MGKDKLLRFEALKTFSNVYEPVFREPFPIQGNWRSEVFQNENPIILELGCGKGEYSVGLGRKYPEKNFIGLTKLEN